MNLMTRKEIAEFLKVTTMTIDRYERAGMPTLRPPKGGDPKYNPDEVIEWMKTKPEEKEG